MPTLFNLCHMTAWQQCMLKNLNWVSAKMDGSTLINVKIYKRKITHPNFGPQILHPCTSTKTMPENA